MVGDRSLQTRFPKLGKKWCFKASFAHRCISISRLNARPTQMHTSQKNHPLSLNTYKIVNKEDIQKALAEIESSKAPDYTIIARKYRLMWSILSRYARGLTTL